MSGRTIPSGEFAPAVREADGPAATLPAEPGAAAAPVGIVEFNEASYLATFPDVRALLAAGRYGSAIDHYRALGQAEQRLASPDYLHALANGRERAGHGALSFNIDVVIASAAGTVFVVGWADDRGNPLLSLSVIQGDEGWNTRAIARCRRTDVEELLGASAGPLHGFWAIHRLAHYHAAHPSVMLRARFADGQFTQLELTPRVVAESDLRETVLGHFASLSYLGNRDIESFRQLETGAGSALVALNRSVCAAITASAHVERYGPHRARFAASFIVCLFGKSEYFFLQNALFSGGAAAADIEFVYVSNSPELAEALQKEARIAERIYGLSLTLVTLTGNAGFSAANNVAAAHARSDRVVFVNPDVFPTDSAWAATHRALLDGKPAAQTRLFGAPLYYDDGSLMHGGMYFEQDTGLSVTPTEVRASAVIRVEHYGKGTPAWSDRYTAVRPVPAVTGAFISADRAWFERLGGLTEDYMFGHYEDADLCLKSLQAGTPAWLQDIRFWHMEGKGSVRRPPHEGGSLVNRWLFTRRWGPILQDGLLGRAPTHPLLANPPGPVAAPAASPAAKAPVRPVARPRRQLDRARS